jgi:hypothetical protein
MSSEYENIKKGFKKGLGKPGKRKTFGDLIDAITPDFAKGEPDEVEVEVEVVTTKEEDKDKKKKKPVSKADRFKSIRDALNK